MEEALESFLRLSSALVGEDQLPEDLAAVYFERARSALAGQLRASLERFAALLRDGIGAHPPTLSNGYFGHWKYPAEC